jgi:peptide-methionine (R)-S-oxide reductase
MAHTIGENVDKIIKSEQEWKEILTDEEYRICREKGTERAFSGEHWQCADKQGAYTCTCCGSELFDSKQKFDSGTGWPSFSNSIVGSEEESSPVETKTDSSFGMSRTEVLCSKCDSHLGHVFFDGPEPTGLRYCINSASIKLEEGDD